jgi:hypothetical protein
MAAAAAAADDDPLALVRGQYDADELAIAGEFLTTWLPFLSAGLCPSCVDSLRGRVESLLPRGNRRRGRRVLGLWTALPRVSWCPPLAFALTQLSCSGRIPGAAAGRPD